MESAIVRLLLWFGASVSVVGYPTGPPVTPFVCKDMFPVGHDVDAQDGDPPYVIHLSQNVYTPWEELRITVRRRNQFEMKGLFIQARRANCSHPLQHEPLGTFQLAPTEGFLKTLPCMNRMNSSLSHTRNYGLKSAVFKWFAPAASIGHIYFVATIVKEQQVFWTNVYSEILRDIKSTARAQICPARHLLDPSGPQPFRTTSRVTDTSSHVSSTTETYRSAAPTGWSRAWPELGVIAFIVYLFVYGAN